VLSLFQKLKLLQKTGNAAQSTVDSKVDGETALARLTPEGASSNSVRTTLCLQLLFVY